MYIVEGEALFSGTKISTEFTVCKLCEIDVADSFKISETESVNTI